MIYLFFLFCNVHTTLHQHTELSHCFWSNDFIVIFQCWVLILSSGSAALQYVTFFVVFLQCRYISTLITERRVFVDRWWWDMMARAKTHCFSCSFLIGNEQDTSGLCQWMLHRHQWEPNWAGTWVDCLHLHDSEFSYTFIFNLDRFELVAQEEDSEHFTQSFCATNILKQTDIVLYKKIKQHSKKQKTKLEQKTNYDYWK